MKELKSPSKQRRYLGSTKLHNLKLLEAKMKTKTQKNILQVIMEISCLAFNALNFHQQCKHHGVFRKKKDVDIEELQSLQVSACIHLCLLPSSAHRGTLQCYLILNWSA